MTVIYSVQNNCACMRNFNLVYMFQRPNVYLNIKKSRSYEKELLWYVEELRRDGRVTKKAIIYCR